MKLKKKVQARREPMKEVKVEAKKEVKKEVKVEVITPPKLFTTSSQVLAQKLEVEGGFTYKSIGVDNSDPLHQTSNFTFNATEKEVQDFLNGRK